MNRRFAVACALLVTLGIFAIRPATAGPDQEEIVVKARYTLQRVMENPEVGPNVRDLMKSAKAVMIFPNVLKGAFIFGAEGGHGVLLAKGHSGDWSYPGFYFLGGASFGLQIGGQSSEIVLLIMSSKALTAIVDHKVKLGGDISAAVGPVGVRAAAATTTALGADVISFALNQGAFLGASLEGAVINARESWSESYYGNPKATAKAVVLEGQFSNRNADPLRAELASIH